MVNLDNKYYEYNTLQGDTWDSISLDFYGDEHYTHVLIGANPKYQNVLIFNADIELIIPIIEESAAESLPPWKQGDST